MEVIVSKQGMDVGLAIRYWRKAKGFSQGKIAKLNSWERSYVSDLERGKIKNPGMETILSLIDALGIDCNDFVNAGLGRLGGYRVMDVSIGEKEPNEGNPNTDD